MDTLKDSEDDCEADDKSDIELHYCIKASESPEHWVVSAAPNVPGLIWPTWKSIKMAEMGLMTNSTVEARTNNRNKKKYDRLGQYVFSRFFLLLDR